MTPEEKFDATIDSSMNDRRDLIGFLENQTDAQAGWEPPDGEWSIAQGVEHILLTDDFARKMLVETLETAQKTGNWNNAPDNPQKLTSDQLRRREQGPVPAPEQLHPVEGRPLSEMIPLLMPAREETNKTLAPYRERDLERLNPPATRYGDLNIYDRMNCMGIHDALHKEQMARVTQASGFPAAG